jgi:type I restriction enzyme S subunit
MSKKIESMSRTMKDSGIPWIGEIPEGWVLSRIKNCTDIVMGQSPDGDSISSEPVGYLFMQGNTEFSDKYPNPSLYCQNPNKLSRVGDILMSVRAPVGALNISDKIYGIGRGLCSIKNINIDKSYLWYYLLKSSDDFDYYGNGSTFSAITVSSLNSVPLLLPPLAEQHLIATFLDKKCSEIDSLIELQEQMIEELKAYKQSVITEAVTKGIRNEELGVRNYKDSGIEWIGDVPEEWEVKRLKQVLSLPLQYGANESGIPYQDGLPRYVRITDILDNSLKNDIEKQSLTNQQAEGYILKHNDILFARSGGTVGKSFIFSEKYGLCAFAGYLIKARVNELMEAKFVYYFTQTNCYDEWKKQIFIQSTIQNIGADRYSQLQLPIPPLAEQQAIADYLDKKCGEIDELIIIKQQKIESLKEYKKSVIYEYVTGKKEP